MLKVLSLLCLLVLCSSQDHANESHGPLIAKYLRQDRSMPSLLEGIRRNRRQSFFKDEVDMKPSDDKDLDEIISNIFGSKQMKPKQPEADKSGTQTTKPTNGQKCTTSKGKSGQCVAYYLCSTITGTYTEDIVDFRTAEPICESYIDTCCELVMTKTASPEPAKAKA